MDHQLGGGLVADAASHFQGGDGVLEGGAVGGEADLHTKYKIPVFFDALHSFFRAGVAKVFKVGDPDSSGHGADGGEVDERQQPRVHPLYDVAAEARKVHPAGAAGVYGRGDANGEVGGVGVGAAGRDAVGEVAVKIYQPRRHQFTLHVYDFIA